MSLDTAIKPHALNLIRNGLTHAQLAAKTVAHGLVGGFSGKVSGGSFSKSFVSAGFTHVASPGIDAIGGGTLGGSGARIVAGGVVGGTAASLAGGRFEDGFRTGVLSRGLNGELHRTLTAKAAFKHYMGGSGDPLKAPFGQLNTEGVSPTDFQEVRDSIAMGPGEYSIDGRLVYTESRENFLVFGDVTLRLQGALTVQEEGWKFNGNLKAFEDYYDFNPSTHRGFMGEVSTAVGRYAPGEPYWIEMRGSRRIYAGGGP